MASDGRTAKERAAARFVPRHSEAAILAVEEVDVASPRQRAAARFRGQSNAPPSTVIVEKGSAKDRARQRFVPTTKDPSVQPRVILVDPPADDA